MKYSPDLILKYYPLDVFYTSTLERYLEKYPIITKFHSHCIYLVLYITEGSGKHEIDGKEYHLQQGSFVMIEPFQVHRWEFAKDIQGYILFFTPEIYSLYSRRKKVSDLHWFSQKTDEMKVFKETENELVLMMDLMVKAYESNDLTRFEKILSLLNYVLLQMPSYVDLEIPKGSSFYHEHWKAFQNILEEHFKTEKSPLFYAKELGISLKHLNRISMCLTHQTVTQTILARVVLQAQRMWMVHPKGALSEIAFHLGYMDTAHFSKIFKKYTQMTITAFKKKCKR